ncbi:MAG: hypothetical protein E7574_05170 [Ruminococcaceae bacterium]|nr:hypothetical protein [Oscillospiraceae bacterium]
MFVQQSRLAEMLLYSLVLGVFLGLVYDVFRIRRLVFFCDNENEPGKKAIILKHKNRIESIIIFFEDILFWLVCSVSICIFIYYINSGRFRSISIVGAVAGFLVYYNTVGRLVMMLSDVIIRFLKLLFKTVIKYTVYPVCRVLKYIYHLTLGNLFRYVFNKIQRKRFLNSAKKGFGITQIKGKIKNEKSFKYIRKGGGSRIYSVLRSNDNSNAV